MDPDQPMSFTSHRHDVGQVRLGTPLPSALDLRKQPDRRRFFPSFAPFGRSRVFPLATARARPASRRRRSWAQTTSTWNLPRRASW
jgi:hypothetical protein